VPLPAVEEPATSPIWRQYIGVKRRHANAIVFFRMGDFYETFEEDAKLCARELDLTLTSKPMGSGLRVPLAGIPHHAVDSYVARLVNKGYRVAIAEQMADPASVKGLVPREVTRVVTPGTAIDEALLAGSENNYLVAALSDGERVGIARIDVSTGEFVTQQCAPAELRDELLRIGPRELLAGGALELGPGFPAPQPLGGDALDDEQAADELLRHFGAATLEPFGCAALPLAICAAAAVLRYLRDTQPAVVTGVTRLATADARGWMTLDAQTTRNLELFGSGRVGSRDGGLIAAIDRTRTPMGARLLRRWLSRPLVAVEPIRARLCSVAWLAERETLRGLLLATLARSGDLERLTTRCGANAAKPRELHS
jgi:DNA mismatch repair protein MutS